MSAKELLKMTEDISSAVTNTQGIRDKIFAEFAAATTGEQRDSLLAMFAATMDVAESWHAGHSTPEQLAAFKEARADDYTKLVVQESCVDGNVSPELLIAVTNREIAAGRMKVDDPIRQVAVKAAASPHPSHAEMVEQAAVKRRGDAVIQTLIDEMKATKTFDVIEMRAKIQKAWDAATTSEQYGTVLGLFKAIMDQVERTLEERGEARVLEEIRKARDYDYRLFVFQECMVGLDSPGGADISVERLMAVTNREIAAGRMTEDHSARKIAVEGAAAPHLSHAELVAKHARLKADAQASRARKTRDRAAVAYGIGSTLGRKFRGIFGK